MKIEVDVEKIGIGSNEKCPKKTMPKIVGGGGIVIEFTEHTHAQHG